MFRKLFGQRPATPADTSFPAAPEVMGLRLGGAFELDSLRLKLLEPQLVVKDVAPTQLIQAVGDVQLDESSWLLRFYTDDDAFLQILLTGGRSDAHITDAKLWHFYDTQSVGSDADWRKLLEEKISQPSIELEGHTYQRVWESTGSAAPPVAMTETTHSGEGLPASTDQFAMLYQREIGAELFEYVLYAAEEKIIDERVDRCLVISTGMDLGSADFTVT